MIKTRIICDLCGNEAETDDTFILPRVYLTCRIGQEQRKKEHICKIEINLCDQCKKEVSRAVFGQDIRRI